MDPISPRGLAESDIFGNSTTEREEEYRKRVEEATDSATLIDTFANEVSETNQNDRSAVDE